MTDGADEGAVQPWQARLEVVALLLLVTVAVSIVARLVGAYEQAKDARQFGASVDLVQVVRFAGEQTGFIAAGGILVAFLLVALGPGVAPTGRGRLALRSTTVLGLLVAGLAAFAGIATLVISEVGGQGLPMGIAGEPSLVDRLSSGVPLLLAAAIAGYVAWCAFSTLGEEPGLLFPGDDGDAGDLGEASEGQWAAPPPAPPSA
jgi:hypothetical protein